MDPLTQALRGGALQPPRPMTGQPAALVVGAGGTLGAAVLAEALVGGRFARVAALVDTALTSAVRGMQPLPADALAGTPRPLGVDIAFVVYERGLAAHGRDEAFARPDPAALGALARSLRERGVRHLVMLTPHAPALLPQALREGLATLDEAAVATLGFEQLVFVRPSQDAARAAARTRIEAFVAWWLSQLRWMVPQREQPVRAAVLAAIVVRLARRLPAAPPATRVLTQDIVWQAAQGDADAALEAWLGPP